MTSRSGAFSNAGADEASHAEGMIRSVATIYVKLMDEAVDVWRPVDASLEGDNMYRLADTPMPTEEVWEFQPGSVVRCERRDLDGEMSMVAVTLA